MLTSSLTKGCVTYAAMLKAVIPTLLTMSRVVLLPFIVWALCAEEKRYAFLFFVAAEITDILDGFFARRWKVESEDGGFMDTLADKAFHLPLLFYFLVYPRPDLPHLFLYRNITPQTLFAVACGLAFAAILAIEVMLILSRTPLLEKWRTKASNKAGLFGKIKTWIHAFAIGGYIIGATWSVTAGQLLIIPAVAFGLLSLASRVRFIRTGN
jgi:phosphatidylglycerophosphate synthase